MSDTPIGCHLLATRKSSGRSSLKTRLITLKYTGDMKSFLEFIKWLNQIGIEHDNLTVEIVTLPDGSRYEVLCTKDIFVFSERGKRICPEVLDALRKKQFTDHVFQALQKRLLKYEQ